MAAAFSLGAEAVQIGSLFVASPESSAHQNFKNLIVDSKEGATELSLKQLTPVRLLKNKFHQDIQEAQSKNASTEDLRELLGRGRAKKGMFEGDLVEGELEIGQISSAINTIKPAAAIVAEVWADFNKTIKKLQSSF
jgi:enoyl-[acyl-carrier protein] reductase II